MTGIELYLAMQTPDPETLVLQHAPLVKRIAYHLMARLPPSVQIEDLIQSGMVGLLEAAKQYDQAQGASFETYAGIRIRGAMLDELRRSDWTPRSVHRKARDVADAMRRIEARVGRDARDQEVADEMGIALAEYHQILQDSLCARLFSMEELALVGEHGLDSCVDPDAGPIEGLSHEGFAKALEDAIASLPERERLVISLYYEKELNLREIGEVLNVTESRVCQIQGQAMLRLRARMSDWLDIEDVARPRRGRRRTSNSVSP